MLHCMKAGDDKTAMEAASIIIFGMMSQHSDVEGKNLSLSNGVYGMKFLAIYFF